MFDEDEHDNHNNDQGDAGRGYDTSDDSVEGADDWTTEYLLRRFTRAAIGCLPLSAEAQSAAMTVIDDVAELIAADRARQAAEEQAESARMEEVERLARIEAGEVGRLQEDLARAYRREASAEAASVQARLDAAVTECELRRELADALSRASSAEAALEAMVPAHWAATLLREATLQQERHIVSTVEIAEGMGATRAYLEGALRQHIAQRSAHTSQLALDLLLSPLGRTVEEPDPKTTKGKKGKRSGVA
jgi:hypothetical protein